MKNIQKLMKEAQKLQQQMAKAEEELSGETLEVTSGGGMVTVTVNGQGEIQGIKIKPEVVDSDEVEMLEDLILAAAKEAFRQSKELAQQKMGNLGSGLNLPGMGL